MELTYNNGSAFFYIESPDFVGLTKEMKSVSKMISQDVISFSYTEEVGRLTTGSLSLRDNTGVYSKVFRNGRRFTISFGYKTWNQDIKTLGINSTIPRGIRQALNCIITTPAGSADETGGQVYTVGFMAEEVLGDVRHLVYDSGTIGNVIKELFIELGVTQQIIDFKKSYQRLTSNMTLVRRESTFQFLRDVAKNWGCYFTIGRTPSGTKVGIFVDSTKMNSISVKRYISTILAVKEEEKEFYYNSGQQSNVKSYTWQQHVGESGTGDNVQLSYVDGKPVFTRSVAKEESVTVWRLNNERVAEFLRASGTISGEIQAFQEIAGAKDFKKVQKFFDPVETTTAPQGMGYTVNLEMHGDPFVITFMRVRFKNGFPACITHRPTSESAMQFYVKKTTNTFTKGEYSTSVEVVDTYNGSFIVPKRGDITPS